EMVKKLERRNKSRTLWLKRLRKVGRTARIESSKDKDKEVTLIDETQGRNDDKLMFDTGVLDEQEVEVEKVVSTAEVTTASATTTTVDELTLAQTLIEIKAAKPKAVTTAATTTIIAFTRPKTRGVVVQEPSEFTTTTSPSQLPQAKDKGKAKWNDDNLMFDTRVLDEQEVEVEKVVSTAEVTTASATTTVEELTLAQTLIEIKEAKPKVVTTAATTTTTAAKGKGKAKMVELEKPLKKKDQILIDEEITQRLQEELQAELEEEEKLARQKEEDENIPEWDNVQAMIDADYELAARLQAQEQEELTIKERSKIFVELMDKRKKHFARLRAEEQRIKPPTKTQKRNTIEDLETLWKLVKAKHGNTRQKKGYEECYEILESAYLYAGREKVSTYTCNNHKIAQQEASS
ncbi:hypothetical protein Tco_1433999, partial [Tanacetum coccineum]